MTGTPRQLRALETLRANAWNYKAAAADLGIAPQCLRRLIGRLLAANEVTDLRDFIPVRTAPCNRAAISGMSRAA